MRAMPASARGRWPSLAGARLRRFSGGQVEFRFSPKVQELRHKLIAFMAEHVYPNQENWQAHVTSDRRWEPVPIIEELKAKARAAGLWNLWQPKTHGGTLSNLEYAPLCEIMGRVLWAPEIFNCSAPDTGNMETILRYGTPEQTRTWCEPYITRDGEQYVINGVKWWSSGAGDPRCKIYIVMGKTDRDNPSTHRQQSMVLVPADAKGLKVVRYLPVFGYDDAPHGHMQIELNDVRVPTSNVLLGEGRGFEIAQGRLGPGRIHHCMRLIGQAEVALEKM